MPRPKGTAQEVDEAPGTSEVDWPSIFDQLMGEGKAETFRVAVRLLLREASKSAERREGTE